MTYSHSSIETYRKCPFQFKLHYIDRVQKEEREGIEAFLGSRVHEILERLYKDLLHTKLNTLEEILTHYNRLWDKNWNDDIVITKKNLNKEDYHNLGEKCIKSYYSRYHPFDQTTTLRIEECLDFYLDNERKYHFIGYIDRLDQAKDGSYEIHDYKTSGYLPIQEDMDADRQLTLYHLGIKGFWKDIHKVRLIWHYLSFDKEICSFRSDEQLEEVRKETISLIDEIESRKEFPSVESPLCDWCEYWRYCPKRRHYVKVEGLPANQYLSESGVKLVNRYASLKNNLKETEEDMEQVKEAIFTYVKQENVEVILGNDCQAKVKIKMEAKFPTKTNEPQKRQQLDDLIKQSGRWLEVSELNTITLTKTIESNEWDSRLITKIKEFQTPTESKSISLSKSGKSEN